MAKRKFDYEKIVEYYKSHTGIETAQHFGCSLLTVSFINGKFGKRKKKSGRYSSGRLDGAKLYGEYLLGSTYSDLAQKYKLDEIKIRIAIGHHLMNLCRKDKNCPVKALLPEFDSSKL